MILAAGTFRVADYRKPIPDWVKVVAAIRTYAKCPQPTQYPQFVTWVRNLQFDHTPALNARDYDLDAGDFIPSQNDPEHIVARLKADHLLKTTGRKPDAERTATTLGSDIGEAKRTRDAADAQAVHDAKMANKRGDFTAAARILGTVKRKSRLRSRPIPSRPFSKQKRPMRSKNATKKRMP